MNEFPKLLIVTSFSPDGLQGGPYVMRQLLRDYPREQLAWWCVDKSSDSFLSSSQIYGMMLPGRLVARKRFKTIKNTLIDRLWVPSAARNLTGCLDRWAPDIVVCLAHSWVIPVLTRVWKARTSRRLHLIVHDFMDHCGYVETLGARRAGRFAHDAEFLYTIADSRTVIGTEMARELFRSTGMNAELVAPCGVEPEDVQYLKTKPRCSCEKEIRIIYPGTITAPETFKRFLVALEQVRNVTSRHVFLDFYGSADIRKTAWFRPAWMKYGGTPSEAELTGILRAATFGLCLMNDDLSNPRYDKYSFPCKFTAHLAAGLPVIAVGHSESSLARMMKKFPVGLCLEENVWDMWPDQLIKLFGRLDPRSDFHEASMSAIHDLFDAREHRRAFYTLIKGDPLS